MIWQCCGVPGCEWSQLVTSQSDGYSVRRAHGHDCHGGTNRWTVATASGWRPPMYRPGARDYLDHLDALEASRGGDQ